MKKRFFMERVARDLPPRALFMLALFYGLVPSTLLAAPTISYVQGNSATPQIRQTTVNVRFNAAQNAGDLNVVVVAWNDSTAALGSIGDTRGNIYALAAGPTTISGRASQSIYYASNILAAGAGANTVTVTFSAAVAFPDIRILEYAGVDPTNPIDVEAALTGTSSTSNSGSVTTTNAIDLLFGANYIASMTAGPGNGFASRLLTKDGSIAEDQMVTVTGSYTATAPLTSFGWWIMQVVAFRAGATPTTTPSPPSAPSNLTATATGASQIALNWTASTSGVGIANYVVQRCQGAGCSNLATIATPAGTTYTDTALVPSTTYSYRVQGVDTAGAASPMSNLASATTTQASSPPTAPSNLTAMAASARQITLSWTASTSATSGIANYVVQRCQGASCASFAPIATPTDTAYAYTGRAPSASYSYDVYAVDTAGTASPVSNVARAATSGAPALSPYATNFALIENPIAEGGNWVNGQTVGLDWHDVRTNGTQAYGTQDGSTNYTDSIAILGGTWGPDQISTATVRTVNQQSGDIFEEVELLLRFSISGHTARGYEVNYACRSDGSQYAEIVRWNGPLGSWTLLDSRNGPGLKDGDRVKATIVGNTITTYLNDVALYSVTDATYASGNPGIGFYLQGGTGALASDYGFTSFTASDGSTTVDTFPPSAPTNLSSTAVLDSQISLGWTASTDNVGVAGYQVFRDANQVATTTTAVFSDTGLTPSTQYLYAVAAFDAAGNVSAQSASLSVATRATDTTPPSVPSGLQSSKVTSSSLTLTWTASTDDVATAGYQVFRNGVQVATIATTSFADSGLDPLTTYNYAVAAYDYSNNISSQSQPLYVTTTARPVAAPFIVQLNQNLITSGTSASIAFHAATNAGNTIVAYVVWNNTSGVTLTDSRGDAFVSASGPTSWGNGYSAQVFYASNIAGGATKVTATFLKSLTSFGVVYVHEYAGISTANPVDATAAASGSSTSLNSGNVTTTSPDDLLFGAGVSDDMVTAAGAGFAPRDMTYGNITEDEVASSTGSYSATATHSGNAWAMQVVAFRAAN